MIHPPPPRSCGKSYTVTFRGHSSCFHLSLAIWENCGLLAVVLVLWVPSSNSVCFLSFEFQLFILVVILLEYCFNLYPFCWIIEWFEMMTWIQHCPEVHGLSLAGLWALCIIGFPCITSCCGLQYGNSHLFAVLHCCLQIFTLNAIVQLLVLWGIKWTY